jgi:hypothetical protein
VGEANDLLGPKRSGMRRIIAVRPLNDNGDGRVLFLDLDQVAYIFRGSAVAAGLIRAEFKPRPDFEPTRLYVRTINGKLYQAIGRSLSGLILQFGEPFLLIHQSMAINENAVAEAFFRPVEVGMRVIPPGVEYLTVARSRGSGFRRRFLGGSNA